MILKDMKYNNFSETCSFYITYYYNLLQIAYKFYYFCRKCVYVHCYLYSLFLMHNSIMQVKPM